MDGTQTLFPYSRSATEQNHYLIVSTIENGEELRNWVFFLFIFTKNYRNGLSDVSYRSSVSPDSNDTKLFPVLRKKPVRNLF